jgi:hypothetical protein
MIKLKSIITKTKNSVEGSEANLSKQKTEWENLKISQLKSSKKRNNEKWMMTNPERLRDLSDTIKGTKIYIM